MRHFSGPISLLISGDLYFQMDVCRTAKEACLSPPPASKKLSRLDAITTHWSRVRDPSYFVLRYDLAIRKYLSALLRNEEAVQEVIHEVLLGILKRGLGQIEANAGRFRDYLRASLRHAVYHYWRGKQKNAANENELDGLASPSLSPEEETDRAWIADWRECLLDRTWRALLTLQDNSKGASPYYTVLRLAVEHPNDTSTILAARAEAALQRSMRPDGYRQQLRRARRRFAELLRDEVARTLDDPTPEAIVDEFIDLGIFEQMREYIHPKLRDKVDERKAS
jgi:hypothetical protein